MNTQTFANQLFKIFDLIQANLHLTLLILGLLWIIQIINYLTGYRLNNLGIYPRHLQGLPGILFSPFLHGSFTHLFFNSIPLLVLIDFMLLTGTHHFLYLTLLIMLGSGFATWLFARPSFHVGASHVVMGYWGYLLINAYQHPSILTVMLAILCVYYFGGLLLSIFPQEEKTSWEGHLFGFLTGITVVYIEPFISI